jgi:hypothetical protein
MHAWQSWLAVTDAAVSPAAGGWTVHTHAAHCVPSDASRSRADEQFCRQGTKAWSWVRLPFRMCESQPCQCCASALDRRANERPLLLISSCQDTSRHGAVPSGELVRKCALALHHSQRRWPLPNITDGQFPRGVRTCRTKLAHMQHTMLSVSHSINRQLLRSNGGLICLCYLVKVSGLCRGAR